MSNWYSRAPVEVPDNAQKPETVLYGPKGEALVVRQPRPVGFRHPEPSVTVTTPAGQPNRVETLG